MAEQKTEFLITARDLTKEAFDSVHSGLGKIGSALGSVQSAIIGAVGIGGMAALVKSSMDATDALAKAADRLGVTTEALAGLRYAGDLAGVSAEQLDTGLSKMSMNLAKAASGSAEANEAFRTLGLSSRELSQIPADQAFMRISDALMSVDNNMQRLNLTQEIFGKSGRELINLMAEGSESLMAARQEAEKLGIAMSRVDAAKIEIANDSLTRIKSVFAGVGNTIALQLSPYIQAVADWLVKSSTEADGFRSHIQTAIEVAAKAVGFLADMFRGLHLVWKLLEQAWAELQNIILQGLNKINEGIASFINILPGLNVKPNANLQTWAKESGAEIEKARAELEALAMSDMPSKGIEEFFAKIKQLNAELAQAKAEQAAKMAGTGEIEDDAALAAARELTLTTTQELYRLRQEIAKTSIDSEMEMLASNYQDQLDMLVNAEATEMLTRQQFEEAKAQLDEQYRQQRTKAQDQWRAKEYGAQANWMAQVNSLMQGSFNQQLQGTGIMLGQMSSLMLSHKKKEFEIGKKAAIGQALVNTYLGFAQALSYGFPMGLIFGALVLATGMMNVARIRSQQFGGGAAATPTFNANPGTGLPEPVGGNAGEPIAPSLPQQATAGGGAARNVNITIESDSGMVSMDWVQNSLAPVLNEAMGDGLNLNVMRA